MDPFKNDFDSEFEEYDWADFYGDIQEEIPENVPEARGESVTTTMFVDADQESCFYFRYFYFSPLISKT